MLSIVVAHSSNRAIGRRGELPWRLPSDLRRFRDLTLGHTVVMGRKTFQSLPDAYRPLPGRRNVVISADPSYSPPPGVDLRSDIEGPFVQDGEECFVIGGGSIYTQLLGAAGRVYATEIDAHVEGDTFFEQLAASEWERVQQSEPLHENGHSFVFCTYERRR
jgi:dihydrofolate reductase